MSSAPPPETLRTLGGLSLGDFRQVKPLLVAVYVALEGQTPRRQLAELLWPDAQKPDSSLRVALHALRERFPDAIRQDDPLETGLTCDAAELLTLQGQAALEAYAGPFLHSMNLRGVAEEFAEWALSQQERLAQHVQTEALAWAEQCDPAQAAQLAERIFRLPGAAPAEPDLLRRLLALTLPGSVLETELRGELAGFEAAAVPALPAERRGRVLGRDAELDQLLAWAAPEGGGVAMLSGVGGVGKSTLGRELLRELAKLGRDVTQVDAEGVTYSGDLLARLAHMRSPGAPQPESVAGLAALLGQRPVVLLDGIDALEGAGEFVSGLRADLPEVRWVLTGRRSRLGAVQAGLTHPDSRETFSSGSGVLMLNLEGLTTPPPDAEFREIAASSAVKLLVREGQRVRRDFAVTPENADLLASLSRRLQGHPLALSLAASWLRVENLNAVYERVLAGAATLQDATGGSRRGLALVLARSWELLGAPEQAALLRLSVCADFDPRDALALGVTDEQVGALLEHSFLEAYLPGSERLRIYPALSSVSETYGPQHPELIPQARANHAAHYLTWFAGQSPSSPPVADELGNLQTAVLTALHAGTLDADPLYALMRHYETQAKASSGTEVFQNLCDAAEDANAPADVQAAAQIACMWLAYRAYRLLDAQTLATRFLASPLAEELQHRMKALNTLALVRKEQGQLQVAAVLTEQALQIAKDEGDIVRQAMYMTNLLSHWVKLGEFEQIQNILPIARLITEQVGWIQLKVVMLWLELELPSSDYEKIISDGQRMLLEAQNNNELQQVIEIRSYIGRAFLELNQPRKALEQIQEAISLAQKVDNIEDAVNNLYLESRAFYRLGRTPQARISAKRGIQSALAQNSKSNMVDGLLVVAIDLLQSHAKEIYTYLSSLMDYPESLYSQKREANLLLQGQNIESQPFDPRLVAEQLVRWL